MKKILLTLLSIIPSFIITFTIQLLKKLTLSTITLFTISAFAQTTVPGGVVNGNWGIAGSPYNIQGSIVIPDNTTLTIEPGVVVNFEGTYKILVLGRLLAEGLVNDTITHSSEQLRKTPQ